MKCSLKIWLASGVLRAAATALLCCVFAALADAQAAAFQDFFTNRETIFTTNGTLVGDNSAATVETGEPQHGGKVGGHSLWISWVAPTNGIVAFKTETSDFDTLLSAYQFTTTNGIIFADLREVARADDSEGFERESEIEFGVVAGERYEIAVDGYFGAVGELDFQWNLAPRSSPPPQILNTLADRSVNFGDAVSLVFNVTNAGAGNFKWYLNGNELAGVNSTNLTISSFAVANVGRYKMRVALGGGVEFYSVPLEIQINTDGEPNTLARGKILDAPETPLIGGDGSSLQASRSSVKLASTTSATGVVLGYNGSQIFNTTYATVDTNEPPHCGISGGSSYWLVYQPPANGTIALDTIGSTYDTVMEAYTYNGALTGYQDLISIACDNDGVGTNGASRVQFSVMKSRQYVIVVEGVNNAHGTAWLNYSLNTNQQPTAPTLLAQPTTVTVPQSSPATLAASLSGTPPLRFSWKKNTTPMPGATSPGIFFPSTIVGDTANYVLTVTNDLGSLTATLPLHVVVPPQCSLLRTSTWLQLSFPTLSGLRYTVQEAGAVVGPWQPWPTFFIGDGQPLILNVPGGGVKFYRVQIE